MRTHVRKHFNIICEEVIKLIEIHANASYVTRRDSNIILTGQYGVATLTCTFDDSVWAGTDKWAVFTVPGLDKPIKNKLVDNKCLVPIEALDKSGPVLIGVYGELIRDGALVKRLSPAPIAITVRNGSYDKDAVESDAVTINDWFAQQTATAQQAAHAAIEAARIANQIAEDLKKQKQEVSADE